jgi:hypothetical protein
MRLDLDAGAVSSGGASGQGFVTGGGALGQLIEQFDWSQTALGQLAEWPGPLKTTVGLILRSPVPIVTLWGEQGTMIYNDAYSDFAGSRHPNSWALPCGKAGPK